MGYFGNHLATLVTGVFAAVLTGLWPWFLTFAPILDFIFLMAVPITWFLTFTCWISQKSADYITNHAPAHEEMRAVYTADGRTVTESRIMQAKDELNDELETLKDSVKVKDEEIQRLRTKITNLETMVQIESLKAELASIKALASK